MAHCLLVLFPRLPLTANNNLKGGTPPPKGQCLETLREQMLKPANKYRVRFGSFGTPDEAGSNGVFVVPFRSVELYVVISNGGDWDHVSVSRHRCPNWEEMEHIRELFFDNEDTVIQYSPPRDKRINTHNYCLHMWRPHNISIELPPPWMVG